ncbi:hypothetical protein H310_13345 [Aphanomyces invadans]|uniref:Uncharacterized protein n=1 Tax=Aphanomyces invadans TaxID=157072 RepID=A0A024TE37_9STRA|nr:hypothetical protein H310_13345 [Aphanomyces invadans]ETV92284.1 hypothetical protein H310_13345 [Aphanomyces invadans]|eukprot:XP_008879035.1 hypothetical protein H310_13345 [Aphanomyces invadans]
MIRFVASLVIAAAVALVAHAASTADVSTPPLCTSLKACLAYGRMVCDVSTQECPPCMYVDAKGQTLCFDKVAGTALCPFVNTTADCSGGTARTLPPLRNKTFSSATNHSLPSQQSPDSTVSLDTSSSPSSSSWNSLSIGFFVTVLVLTAAIAVAGILHIRSTHAQNPPRRPSTPMQFVKTVCSSPPCIRPSSFSHHHMPDHVTAAAMTKTLVAMSEAYLDTQSSLESGRSESFCHIMEPPRDDSVVRSSDVF